MIVSVYLLVTNRYVLSSEINKKSTELKQKELGDIFLLLRTFNTVE
jgi:hypothetical protein